MTPDEFIEEFQTRCEHAGLREPVVHIDLSAAGADMAFGYILVDPSMRRQRIADRALGLLVQLSDEVGIPLQIIPRRIEVGEGPSDERLEAWYRRHGFMRVGTMDRLMRRVPRQLTASVASP
jgi:GNAT superfamily N-acetyltransferase